MKIKAPADLPFITIELPDPETVPNPGEVVIDLLMNAARISGLQAIEGLLPKREYFHNNIIWFGEILTLLLRFGAVVVFEEFHHAGNKKLGLASEIKHVIDISRGGLGDWGRLYPGKVVMMGSHQQKVLKLFQMTAPLYQRDDRALRLSQWNLSTVMEMANQQGVLSDPKRFLTLWTAYGGIPRHWNRYCTHRSYSHLYDIKDIKEWRHAFIATELNLLKGNQEERFDTKAYIELPEVQREILLQIGQNKPKGDQLDGLNKKLYDKDTREKALIQLMNHLELVDMSAPFYDKGSVRWRIVDNNTLFQISVFGEIVVQKPETRRNEMELVLDQGLLARRMETLEGGVLERMAETWLATQENVTWCKSGVWRSVKKKNENGKVTTLDLEIDVMASNKKHVPPLVWLGSAKRNPERHNSQKVIDEQDLFLDELGKSEAGTRLREKSIRRRMLFSPSFFPEQRAKFTADGFKVVDIHDMARSFDIEPVPAPRPKPDEPDPFDSPSPF